MTDILVTAEKDHYPSASCHKSILIGFSFIVLAHDTPQYDTLRLKGYLIPFFNPRINLPGARYIPFLSKLKLDGP